MADEPVNQPAVQETIPVSVSELARLRQTEARAKQLEESHAKSLVAGTIGEVTGSVVFASDVAAAHARALLAARIVVRPDHNGVLTAFDSQSGRPASEALREALASDEFALYRKAPHQGGASLSTGPITGPSGDPRGPASPTNLADQALARRREVGMRLFMAAGGRADGRSMGNPLGR